MAKVQQHRPKVAPNMACCDSFWPELESWMIFAMLVKPKTRPFSGPDSFRFDADLSDRIDRIRSAIKRIIGLKVIVLSHLLERIRAQTRDHTQFN